MDSKKKLADFFIGMEKNAMGAINMLRTGEGLGLTEEQKKEFDKAKESNNAEAAMKDVEDKLQQFRNKMNGL